MAENPEAHTQLANATVVKSKPSKSTNSTPKSDNEELPKKLKCGQDACKFNSRSKLKMAEHRKSLGHATSPVKKSVTPNLPEVNCDYEGCDFTTQYSSNLSRHKRRRGHFVTESDKEAVEADIKRDEIAKEIEMTNPTESEEEENESVTEVTAEAEEDVTVLLGKKYSPSKITDYFKPVANKFKKKLSMDSEECDTSDKKCDISAEKCDTTNEKCDTSNCDISDKCSKSAENGIVTAEAEHENSEAKNTCDKVEIVNTEKCDKVSHNVLEQ